MTAPGALLLLLWLWAAVAWLFDDDDGPDGPAAGGRREREVYSGS